MQCDLILKCEPPWAGSLQSVQEMMTIPVFPPKLKISYSPVVLWGPQSSERTMAPSALNCTHSLTSSSACVKRRHSKSKQMSSIRFIILHCQTFYQKQRASVSSKFPVSA